MATPTPRRVPILIVDPVEKRAIVPEASDHRRIVESCLPSGPATVIPAALTQAFERAFTALWRRANVTLGEVTLGAVAQRVVDAAVERHPALSGLDASSPGSVVATLTARASALPADELRRALVFVLVEFLTVLGRLTAEILTPGLHAELLAVAGAVPAAREPGEESPS